MSFEDDRRHAHRLGLDKTHIMVLRVDKRVLIDPSVFRCRPDHPYRPLALAEDSTACEHARLVLTRVLDIVVRSPDLLIPDSEVERLYEEVMVLTHVPSRYAELV
jgi:hypothetical protein